MANYFLTSCKLESFQKQWLRLRSWNSLCNIYSVLILFLCIQHIIYNKLEYLVPRFPIDKWYLIFYDLKQQLGLEEEKKDNWLTVKSCGNKITALAFIQYLYILDYFLETFYVLHVLTHLKVYSLSISIFTAV